MTKYNNGKIYKIEPICEHDEGEIYIGTTTELRLCKRMTKHRHDYKKQGEKKTTAFKIFEKYGIENCRILLLENFSCETRDELQAREGYYIRTLKCVNRIINGRTDKEYREDNKEKKKITDKLYYEKNKEKINLQNHDNYNKNKERYLEQKKQYRLEHLQEEKERAKLYRENNKEVCKERDRLKYLRNKEKLAEKLTCLCGCLVSRNGIREHEKTEKHKKLMESLNNQNSIEISS